MFLADVLGVYDVYGGDARAALATAAQVPVNDPLLLVPAMAAVTKHLGFGVTANLSYEPPYAFARRMSTLDHLTEGRIGWNIVTGYLDSAARAAGKTKQTAHDDRYDLAEDYMALVYKLWEQSWDDDAVIADRARGVFADPDRVRAVRHDGPHFKLDALHLCEPSPQRTPVLYQAGTSPAGRAFAGRHAECVFVSGPSAAVLRPRVAALRAAAVEAGRRPDGVKVYALATIVTGATAEAAQAKRAEYRAYADIEGALTLLSGWTGVDFSTLDRDQVIEHVENDAGRTALENITRADPRGAGQCAKPPSMWRSAASDRFSSASAAKSRTRSKPSSRRRTSTASISPSPCGRKRWRTWSIISSRNCKGAGGTERPMKPARCATSCSAPARN